MGVTDSQIYDYKTFLFVLETFLLFNFIILDKSTLSCLNIL